MSKRHQFGGVVAAVVAKAIVGECVWCILSGTPFRSRGLGCALGYRLRSTWLLCVLLFGGPLAWTTLASDDVGGILPSAGVDSVARATRKFLGHRLYDKKFDDFKAYQWLEWQERSYPLRQPLVTGAPDESTSTD